MRRIVVIGSGGSGKSTFATELGRKTGLPVIHLDREYWRENWQKTPADEWEGKVAEMTGRDAWIMDGNFGGTRQMRIAACDTVIFLDLPRYLCLYRILKRTVTHYGRNRPDMAEGCNERFDLEFLLWVWNYPNSGRKRVLSELEKFPEKDLVILRSRNDVEGFLRFIDQSGEAMPKAWLF